LSQQTKPLKSQEPVSKPLAQPLLLVSTSPKRMDHRDKVLQSLVQKAIDNSYLLSKAAIKNYHWLSKKALALFILIKSNINKNINMVLTHRIKRI